MTAPKALNEQAGLNEGSQAGSHFSGKAIAVEARNRSRYKMVDLLAEMPNVRIPADRDRSFRIIVTANSGIVTGISGLS